MRFFFANETKWHYTSVISFALIPILSLLSPQATLVILYIIDKF